MDYKVTFCFKSDEMAEYFIAWFSDGGGEDAVYEAFMDYCGGVRFDTHYNDRIIDIHESAETTSNA